MGEGDRAGEPTSDDPKTGEHERVALLARAHDPLIRALLDSTADSILLVDERLRIGAVNRAVLHTFGHAEADLIGESPSLLLPALRLPDEGAPGHPDAGDGLILGRSQELEAHHKDGRRFPVQCTIREARSAGKDLFVVNLRDLTSQKELEARLSELEAQLRQSQKMEPVGRLAGGIAHDFNNLLTAMRYHASFALEDLPEESAARKEILDLDKAARRAAELTRQLLAFGRRQVLVPRVLDVNEVVDQMASMLTRLIGERIELVTHLDDAAGKVKADPGHLEQVITNLVVNASDAIDGHGRITLRTWPARDPESGGDLTVLSVQDTGPGMTSDVRAKIFDPFFTTKGVGKGTGLGLSTVYGIVRQSHGDIDVETEPGKGSSFHVRLPRVEGKAWKVRRTDHPPTRLEGTETVLLVEDDAMVRRAASRVLLARGYTVLEANDGEEAMRIVSSEPEIDLLLSDVVMPGMSGPELARRLHVLDPRLPVLLTSGYTGTESVLEEVATWPLLPKPFTPHALAQAVREVLDDPERAQRVR